MQNYFVISNSVVYRQPERWYPFRNQRGEHKRIITMVKLTSDQEERVVASMQMAPVINGLPIIPVFEELTLLIVDEDDPDDMDDDEPDDDETDDDETDDDEFDLGEEGIGEDYADDDDDDDETEADDEF